MPIFFHVDRSKKLNQGDVLNLYNDLSDINFLTIQGLYDSNMAKTRALSLFPEGLSKHGICYLLTHEIVIFQQGTRVPMRITHTIPMIETIFEQVRRNEFSELPSRMQSIFAWQTQEQAEQFNIEHGGDNKIFKIEHDSALIRDQNLLYLGGSPIGALELAKQYWQGLQGPNYKPEAILRLPVVVGEQVA